MESGVKGSKLRYDEANALALGAWALAHPDDIPEEWATAAIKALMIYYVAYGEVVESPAH